MLKKFPKFFGLTLVLCLVSTGVLADDYVLDDGDSEGSNGFDEGGYNVWLNQFVVAEGLETITGVSFVLGCCEDERDQPLVGLPLDVYVWDDPNNDGDPSDAVVLGSASGTATNAAADIFQTINIAPVNVGIAGDSFFLGAQMWSPPNAFPASRDKTSPMGRSWIAGDEGVEATAVDPNDLTSAPKPLINYSSEFPDTAGNWLIRGIAVPEPSCLGLFAWAAIVLGLTRVFTQTRV